MKEFIRELIRYQTNPVVKRDLLREYLQARVLQSLQRCGAMISLTFHGGTALRFLYQLPRFSEDLDFSLTVHREGYDIKAYLRNIQSDFTNEGYDIQIKVNEQSVVHAASMRFPGLLYELDLSPHQNEVLSIKLEVDTNPPEESNSQTTLVHRIIPLNLYHHDQASLLSGKLHAILQREYAKGRDLYDLMWYLRDTSWPEPNLNMLNHALEQTGWKGGVLDGNNWRGVIYQRLQQINWKFAIEDVRPFLENPEEVDLITLANFQHWLQ